VTAAPADGRLQAGANPLDRLATFRYRSEGEGAASPPRGAIMKYVWLIAPCVLAVWAPLYNRVDPQIFGVPFFYWLQLLLIPVSALGIYVYDRARKD
jgi:hypothetical protein